MENTLVTSADVVHDPQRYLAPAANGRGGETLADVIAEYVAACQRSNELASARRLDDIVEHHHVGAVSLRFILLGMIAETARHAGHADILAVQIRAAAKSTGP